MKRRVLTLTVVTVAVLGATIGPVAAAWNMSGLGAGATRGGRLQPPAAVPVTVSSAGTHLTWTAPSTGPIPGGYLVTRDGNTICTTTSTACDDTNLAPGTAYTYLVTSTAGRFWVSATPLTMTATTAAGGFTLSAVSATSVTSGVGLTFTVSATYGTGATETTDTIDTAYTGAHPLTITSSTPTSPGGNSSGGPVSPTFVAGIATKVATTVYGSGAQTLIVSDGVRTGSLAITVSPAAASTLQLISTTSNAVVCASKGHVSIAAGQQLTARIAVFDAYGNLAVASSTIGVSLTYTGSGTLSKASLSIPGGHSITTQSFGLTIPSGTVKPGTLNVSVPGTSLSTSCSVN